MRIVYLSFLNLYKQRSLRSYEPGSVRLRGGELAADDCWLEGYQIVVFVGETAPDVLLGEP